MDVTDKQDSTPQQNSTLTPPDNGPNSVSHLHPLQLHTTYYASTPLPSRSHSPQHSPTAAAPRIISLSQKHHSKSSNKHQHLDKISNRELGGVVCTDNSQLGEDGSSKLIDHHEPSSDHSPSTKSSKTHAHDLPHFSLNFENLNPTQKSPCTPTKRICRDPLDRGIDMESNSSSSSTVTTRATNSDRFRRKTASICGLVTRPDPQTSPFDANTAQDQNIVDAILIAPADNFPQQTKGDVSIDLDAKPSTDQNLVAIPMSDCDETPRSDSNTPLNTDESTVEPSNSFSNGEDNYALSELLDEDERPQEESGILYSPTGHLKYPISEHLRYEYYRNDEYQWNKIPFFSIPIVERLKVVEEQEKWLKTYRMKELVAQQTTITAVQPGPTDSTATMTADPENPSNLPKPDPKLAEPRDDSPSSLTTEGLHHVLDEPRQLLYHQSKSDDDLARAKSMFDWSSRSEGFSLFRLAAPLMLTFSAADGVGLVNMAFQGHLSEQALAAASLASFWMNVTGLSLILGINGGIDTLGAQMYGSQQYKMIGLIAMRGALIGLITCVVVALLWYFAYQPLLLTGVEEDIARLAQDYCIVAIWSVPALLFLDIFRRLLEVQQHILPNMFNNVFGLALVAPLNVLFMHKLGWGFIGPAYTYITINYVMCFTLLIYIVASGIWKKTVPTPSRAVFRHWGRYLKVALPSVGTLAGEWLAYEFQQVIAARLGTTALAAQSLVASIHLVFENIPLAIGISVCARIGCFLGSRKPSAALLSYYSAVRVALVVQTLVAVIILAFHKQIIDSLTNVDSVRSAARSVMPLLAGYCLVDGLQGAIQGVLRGFGAQAQSFAFSLFWFWVVAIPVSIGITLYAGTHIYDSDIGPQPGLGLVGVWVSLFIASAGVMVCYLIYLYKTNWTTQTEIIYQSLIEGHNQALHAEDDDSGNEVTAATTSAQ